MPGMLVEAGTALGGSAIVMAAAKSPGAPDEGLRRLRDDPGAGRAATARTCTRATRRSPAGEAKGLGGDTYYGYRDDLLGEVDRSFARLGVPADEHNVDARPGSVRGHDRLDEPVALAHLDGDWYESTMTCLTRIAPQLVPGGRIVLDDYQSWSGCRRAVDEYFADRDGFRSSIAPPPRGQDPRMSAARDVLKRGKRYVARRRDKLRTLKPGDDGPAAPAAEPRRGPPRRRAGAARPAAARGLPARDAARRPDRRRAGRADLRAERRRRARHGAARSPSRCAAAAGDRALGPAHRGHRRRASAATARSPGRSSARSRTTCGAASPPPSSSARACSSRPTTRSRELRALVADRPRGVARAALVRDRDRALGLRRRAAGPRRRSRVFERHMTPTTRRGSRGSRTATSCGRGSPSRPDSPTRARHRTAAARSRSLDYGHPSPTKASAEHRRPHPDARRARAPRPPPERAPARRRRPRRPARASCARARGPSAAAPASTPTSTSCTVHRDASTYAGSPRTPGSSPSAGSCTRCSTCATVPAAPNLRPIFVSFHCNKRDLLTPEAIDVPQALRPDRLPRLDDRRPAAVARRPRLLLRLRDHDDRHRASREPTAPPPADAAARLRRRARRPTARRPTSTAATRSATGRSPPTSARRSPARDVPRASPQVVTSRLHCYLPVRVARRRPSTSGPPTGPTSASTGCSASTTTSSTHPRRAARRDRGGHRRDPRREARGGGLRAVARAHRGRRRRGPRAARPPARAAAGARGDRRAGAPVDRGDAAPRARRASPPTPSTSPRSSRPTPASACPCSSPPCWSTQPPAAPPRDRAARRRGGGARPGRALPGAALRLDPHARVRGQIANPDGSRPDAKGLIRLLLPDLLPDVDRLAIFDLPSVALGDVAELAALDLGGHALAAPTRTDVDATSGFGLLHDAAARLGDRADAATELRRAAHARHAFDFDAFDAHVLVLDLARMRADGFTAQALPLIPAFGLDHLEVLHFLAGPARAELPERWSAIPTRSPARDPQLLHWADGVSPFQDELTPQRDAWRAVAGALTAGD